MPQLDPVLRTIRYRKIPLKIRQSEGEQMRGEITALLHLMALNCTFCKSQPVPRSALAPMHYAMDGGVFFSMHTQPQWRFYYITLAQDDLSEPADFTFNGKLIKWLKEIRPHGNIHQVH